MDPFENKPDPEEHLVVSEAGIRALETAAKWARFLAILGFIGITLLVIAGVVAIIGGMDTSGSSYGFGYGYRRSNEGAYMIIMGLVYIVIAGAYFFPAFYLSNFATQMLEAVRMRTSAALNNAFEQLSSHYKFVGILTILLLSIYLLILFFVFAAGGMR